MTGQAAGVAAGLAAGSGVKVRDVPVGRLQDALVRQGALVRVGVGVAG
jgi:ABC-type transporter Mla subunit MlaD